MTRPTEFAFEEPLRESVVGGGDGAISGAPPPLDCCASPEDAPDRVREGNGAVVWVPIEASTAAFVQSKAATSTSSFPDTSVTLDDDPTAGNLLVLLTTTRGSSAASPTNLADAGWIKAAEFGTGGMSNFGVSTLWYRLSDGTEQTITASYTSGQHRRLSVAEFSGAGPLVGVEVHGPDSTNSSAIDTDAITVADPALLFAAFLLTRGVTPESIGSTWGGSFTEDDDGATGTGFGPRSTTGYRVIGAGTFHGSVATSLEVEDHGSVIAAFSESEFPWRQSDGFTSDGDDATYGTIVGTDVALVDLGAPFRIARTRLRIATENAGARSYTISGANEPDLSDAVVLTTIDFTATGSFTAQDIEHSWMPPSTPYRYYLLEGDDEARRLHAWELYEATIVDTHEHPLPNVEDLATAESNMDLVLKPDGAGGVEWAVDETGSGLPAGGSTGQVLTKQSGADFDADWQTPPGGGGMPSGTSFPGSPSSGDLFHRTDRGTIYQYDGTRWLCTCPHSMPLMRWANVSGSDVLTNAFPIPFAHGANGIWLEAFLGYFYQSSGTTSTNYMTAVLRSWDGGTTTDIASVSSQGNTLNEFAVEIAAINAQISGTADALGVHLAETGAVGGFYGNTEIAYRIIG